MDKLVIRIADIITSLGMVIFVLLMTVIAMIFLGHGLYYKVFISRMPPWQAEMASWILSFGIETTVLVITCNVKYFSGKKLPIFFAICSGIIVLFFIHAFDISQPFLDIAIRWFIGLLVVGVNYVYAELFVKKFEDVKGTVDLLGQIKTLKNEHDKISVMLADTISELTSKIGEIEGLIVYTRELEAFKTAEIEKLTCPYCGVILSTIFKLNAHKGACLQKPKKA